MIVKHVICPTCKGAALYDSSNVSRPFCSTRCQLGDLVAWASDNYKIAGSTIDAVENEYPADTESDQQILF